MRGKILGHHSPFVVLVVAAIVFFIAYVWVFHGLDTTFTWPDERANDYFTTTFAEHNSLRLTDPLNDIADGLIRPRSTGYVDGAVVPVSFLGMIILYGLAGKIVGTSSVLFFTPLLAVVGVLFLYLFLKRIFGTTIACISALLLFAFPPYWYYAMHGMLHNMAFVVFLIVGIYLFDLLRAQTKSTLLAMFSGLSIGLALFIRMSEIVWVVPVGIVLNVMLRRRLSVWGVVLFWSGIVVFFILTTVLNANVYGSPLSFGYSPDAVQVDSIGALSSSFFQKLGKLILPFGIDFSHSASVLWNYVIAFFPWFSIPWCIGLVWAVKDMAVRWIRRVTPVSSPEFLGTPLQQRYAAIYVVVSLWLLVYYGSFIFSEHLLPNTTVLGTSYHRYWLPLFVFGLPLCVVVLKHFASLFSNTWVSRLVFTFLVVSFFLLSLVGIVNDPLQGVLKTRTYLQQDLLKRDVVLQNTEESAVIISKFYDKVFFPSRRVIALATPDESFTGVIENLLPIVPVYFYDTSLDPDSVELRAFLENGPFHLQEIRRLPDVPEGLYRVLYD